MATPTPKPTPSASTMSSATPDPYAGGFKRTTPNVSTTDPIAQQIYNSNDAQRKALATLLSNAGYKVPTTGKQATSIALANAYIQAQQQNATENARLGITKSVEQWLRDNVQPVTGGKTGGPSVQKTTNVLSPTEATAQINKVFQDTLGRDATTEEMKKFKKELAKAEKANPSITKYNTVGGVTTAETSGGLDRDQFITNLINQDTKLASEIGNIQVTDPNVLKREKDKAVYDKAIAAAGGDTTKIAQIASTTSYGKALENVRRQVESIAKTAGATAALDVAEIDAIAKEAVDKALDTNIYQLQAFIDSKLKFGAGKEGYKGKAGETVAALTEIAAANGLDLQKAFGAQLPDWLASINKGESIDTYKRIIRDVAKIGMPEKVVKLMDQGIDLQTIYAPYRNIMASTLEINPQTIDMNDPTLRSAITAENEIPIYDFERALRKDNRWQYTNQAREEVSNATRQILQDFGFMG